MTENWRPITNFKGLYSISDLGRTRSEGRWIGNKGGGLRWWPERILTTNCPQIKGKGRRYPVVTLYRDGMPTKFRVHDLVAREFIGKKPKGKEVLHWDDQVNNCAATNLRYGTHAENGADITRNRVECKHGHKFTKANTYIRRDTGKRQCLACMKIRNDSRPRKTANKRNRKTTLPQHIGVAA